MLAGHARVFRRHDCPPLVTSLGGLSSDQGLNRECSARFRAGATLQARSPLTWIKWSIATRDSFAPSKARRDVPARAGTRSRDRKHSRPAPLTVSEGDEVSMNPLLTGIRHNP